MKKIHPLRWALIGLTLAASGTAIVAQSKGTTSTIPKVAFKDTKLKNGLRVLTVEVHSAPVISLALIYDVGSRNEKLGRTGFAHLFEHMMFQGSANIGKSEHFILVDNNGGFMNGTTDEERTLYFETLPANQLDLLLFLEADRMRSLDISKLNLDNQRNAVQEERRLGVDNQAYGKLLEKFGETMFDNFNYKHSVIGSLDDLNAATVDDVRDFFRIYYAPNNAVLALVGDFKTEDALARVRKAFEPIPAQPMPPPVDIAEPAQTAVRRFTLDDPLAQLPMLLMGFKGPAGNTPDAYALQVLSTVLSGGQSSRLYQKLVKEKQLVVQIGGFPQSRRGPGLFAIQAIIAPTRKPDEVEAAIFEEIEKLKNTPIETWELDKAKTNARRSAVQQRSSSLGLATNLAEATVAYKDPNLTNTRFEKIAAVTREDVMRVAKKYLLETNLTVGVAMPKAKGATAGAGAAK
ncbi:MAG: pitrilysin family protein [Acidobacteriota bacterium]